jgi:uncharacterized membrane protein (UPF0136 family)
MELVLGFIMGILSSPLLLGAACVFGIWCEHKDSGWGLFYLILASIAAVLFFNIPLVYIAYGIPVYLFLGFVWSFYKYDRWVEVMVLEFNEHKYPPSMDEIKRRISVQHNVGMLTYWVLIWPFSFIENFIGDVLTFVSTTIKTRLNGVYDAIMEKRLSKSLNLKPEPVQS